MPPLILCHLTLLLTLCAATATAEQPTDAPKHGPLFRDFVGICGHTVQFKPDLYHSVARLVRDYHPINWDLGENADSLPEWPFAQNRVSWEQVYSSWHKAGFVSQVCLMFDTMPAEVWNKPGTIAADYAGQFAKQFGPGGKWPFVDSLEIGNEPGKYPDEIYLSLFRAMATAARKANPEIKIAPCNTHVGESGDYVKNVDLLKDDTALFDALQIHLYAQMEPWPTWKRTYPENPACDYLSSFRKLRDWRDKHAAGKELWITEFGWDATTKTPDPKTEFAKWEGVTDEQQANWLVRSFFLFAREGADRAYVYFFNDEDQPSLHASSGLTRHFKPKPAYHAVAWMLKKLENYRFAEAVSESENLYLYRFDPEKASDPVRYAVWRTTPGETPWTPPDGWKVSAAEQLPLSAADGATKFEMNGPWQITESPVIFDISP